MHHDMTVGAAGRDTCGICSIAFLSRKELDGRTSTGGGFVIRCDNICMYKYIYIYMYTHTSIHIYIYIYTERERLLYVYVYIYIYNNHNNIAWWIVSFMISYNSLNVRLRRSSRDCRSRSHRWPETGVLLSWFVCLFCCVCYLLGDLKLVCRHGLPFAQVLAGSSRLRCALRAQGWLLGGTTCLTRLV